MIPQKQLQRYFWEWTWCVFGEVVMSWMGSPYAEVLIPILTRHWPGLESCVAGITSEDDVIKEEWSPKPGWLAFFKKGNADTDTHTQDVIVKMKVESREYIYKMGYAKNGCKQQKLGKNGEASPSEFPALLIPWCEARKISCTRPAWATWWNPISINKQANK